ncbi:hypothetical protein B0T16DRAFT_460785 [Cercophora newfieldiana]|uniref:Uncharacterized protein n=1 Tax=Cercophora newfieldiana TaxID=92897 RepID=A0AA39XVZ9_9PEZI|nr:hypothetical protein B0T16DRAFT_460785 [Cercophora newfieldiana]
MEPGSDTNRPSAAGATTTGTIEPGQCLLSALPGEFRNKIYRYLFDDLFPKTDKGITNRKISTDVGSYVYSGITFALSLSNPFTASFLADGPTRHLPSVIIDMDNNMAVLHHKHRLTFRAVDEKGGVEFKPEQALSIFETLGSKAIRLERLQIWHTTLKTLAVPDWCPAVRIKQYSWVDEPLEVPWSKF